jgi:glycine dehydrogenase
VTRDLPAFLAPNDTFIRRHVGPNGDQLTEMLAAVEAPSMDALVDEIIPKGIRLQRALKLGPARGETELLQELKLVAEKNQVLRSHIGQGYHDCIVPPVILRNVLENPSWYTQYTPYQAEIAQGRLEALLNFQTMVADLTGLPLAGSSLLDEATAVGEAMGLCVGASRGRKKRFVASDRCHPQSLDVLATRCEAMGVELVVGDVDNIDLEGAAGVLVQYPDTYGRVDDFEALGTKVRAAGALFVVAADLLALCLLRPPGEFGADVAIGTCQRFGVPMGFGGPHAAYLSTHDTYKRQIPGRIIGMSKDVHGAPALRMALQTREQHIRRDKATSNICTSQVLLAIMNGMFAVYHGADGLRTIAQRVRGLTEGLASALEAGGLQLEPGERFDTLVVKLDAGAANSVHAAANAKGCNLRHIDDSRVGISLDETTTPEHMLAILAACGAGAIDLSGHLPAEPVAYGGALQRTSAYLEHPVFNTHRSEHEMLRYLHKLSSRDLSLTTSMIALGSCTMKLNGTSEMLPVTWREFGGMHPFAPSEQTAGYTELLTSLESMLCEITGFHAVSLQPNAGSQGEYAGMLVIREYHRQRGDHHRDVCLIPTSAHGTNPASAVMTGMKVVAVACDTAGNVDVADLAAKAEKHADKLSAIMITYPSTHGVFEEAIVEICEIVHRFGGQVYMDGANMNAQVGLCRPGDFGPDVCHLNLHKTFCIPHGGGGPGMGPIGVGEHLAPFLPGHSVVSTGGDMAIGAVSAAPWGSPSILPISWVYIALMGAEGLTHATRVAMLAANYMAKRLEGHFDVLFRGARGRVGHEFIMDLRPFEKSAGIQAEDVAKRLMDYGFHSPTLSFPVTGTLMIEPTESESKPELDRLVDALISIRAEIAEVESGAMPREDNPLVNAPHTAVSVGAVDWEHAYTREQAAWPAAWVREHKFWPAVGRIDNGYGDKHLICTCPSVEEMAQSEDDVLEGVGR